MYSIKIKTQNKDSMTNFILSYNEKYSPKNVHNNRLYNQNNSNHITSKNEDEILIFSSSKTSMISDSLSMDQELNFQSILKTC